MEIGAAAVAFSISEFMFSYAGAPFGMYDVGWGHVLDYIGVEWEDVVEE